METVFDFSEPYDMSADNMVSHAFDFKIASRVEAGKKIFSVWDSKKAEKDTKLLDDSWTVFSKNTWSSGGFKLAAEREKPEWAVVRVVYDFSDKMWRIQVAAEEEARAHGILTEITNKLVKIEAAEDSVGVNFWTETTNGPTSYYRDIKVPRWETVNKNYPVNVKKPLGDMMKWEDIEGSGKLVLFHGLPGTGKTSALRVLASEWRKWANIHYVSDPENFFGHSSYMLELLLGDDSGRDDKWRIIVVEDADVLIAQDSKEMNGQALPRLLNLCDGMIGQGLKVMVLMTTNREQPDIHNALKRPGRCLANIVFESFTREESRDWLGDEDYDQRFSTLADLYEYQKNSKQINFGLKKRQPIGFQPNRPRPTEIAASVKDELNV